MGMDYIYGWDKPSCPAFVGTLGLIRALDLLLKDSENITWRIARLELGGEGKCEYINFRALLIFFQGIIDDRLEFRGRRHCVSGGMRHGENSLFVREAMLGVTVPVDDSAADSLAPESDCHTHRQYEDILISRILFTHYMQFSKLSFDIYFYWHRRMLPPSTIAKDFFTTTLLFICYGPSNPIANYTPHCPVSELGYCLSVRPEKAMTKIVFSALCVSLVRAMRH